MTYHLGDQLIDPYLIFEKARLQKGMHIADFGCGRTGHLVFPAAKIIGDTGIVYAVDLLKDVLESVKKRVNLEALTQIHTVWTDLEVKGACAIPEGSLDVVFMVNILAKAKERFSIMREAGRLLREKGRLVIVDWDKFFPPLSPLKSDLLNLDDVVLWGKKNNFVVQEKFIAGKYHSGLVLFRQK